MQLIFFIYNKLHTLKSTKGDLGELLLALLGSFTPSVYNKNNNHIPLFVLSSNYSTNASGAQKIPEKNTVHET